MIPSETQKTIETELLNFGDKLHTLTYRVLLRSGFNYIEHMELSVIDITYASQTFALKIDLPHRKSIQKSNYFNTNDLVDSMKAIVSYVEMVKDKYDYDQLRAGIVLLLGLD